MSYEENALHPFVFEIINRLLFPIEYSDIKNLKIDEKFVQPKAEWTEEVCVQENEQNENEQNEDDGQKTQRTKSEIKENIPKIKYFLKETFLYFSLYNDKQNKLNLMRILNSKRFGKALSKWTKIDLSKSFCEE